MYGKRHEESTLVELREKAKGRYTLPWFQERYGIKEGQKKYEERNQLLSSRPMRGKSNPAYKNIDIVDLEKTIMTTNLNLKQLEERYGVTSTVLYRRFKQLYNCNNLGEVRHKLCKQWIGRRFSV